MPLVMIDSPGPVRRVPVKPRTSIGRDRGSDICLPDRSLSRRHAEIHQRQDGCYIVDMGSTNGTFLNGDRVPRERPLHDGDVIRVGALTLVFHEEQAPDTDRIVSVSTPTSIPIADLTARARREIVDPSELGHRNRLFSVLHEATASLLVHQPLEVLYDRTVELALAAVPAERGALLLIEGHPPVPAMKASRCAPGSPPVRAVSRAIARRIVEDRVALLLPDVLEDAALKDRASVMHEEIRSAICVPLWTSRDRAGAEQDRVSGFLYLDSRARPGAFAEADLEVLTMLGHVAAANIENARLWEETLQKRRLEADLRLAAEIHAGLLPRSAPHLPGYDVAARSRPSRLVGGDYHDFELLGPALHLALGDVAGNGLPAAMLMIGLRAAVRAHWHEPDLAQALSRMNQTFHANVPDDRYATVFCARLGPGTGQMTYVNAGHNPPLLVRGDGRQQRLAAGGTVLGAFGEARYEQAATRMLPGDTLIVFSDGVSDVWPDLETAYQALGELACADRDATADDLCADILAALDGEAPRPPDDRTLLVVKRLPGS